MDPWAQLLRNPTFLRGRAATRRREAEESTGLRQSFCERVATNPPTPQVAYGLSLLAERLQSGSMGSKQTSRIDAYIGGRVRERRVSLGLSARELAEIIGLSTPAVLKYETGGNRILVRRLYEIAQALNLPIEYFFEGLDTGPLPAPTHRRRLLELMRYFHEIEEKH